VNPRQNLAGGFRGGIEQVIVAGAAQDAAGAETGLVLYPFVVSV
jgi:hypothetical protein